MLRSSYIYTVLKLFRPFEGNLKADVARGENELDTSATHVLEGRGLCPSISRSPVYLADTVGA